VSALGAETTLQREAMGGAGFVYPLVAFAQVRLKLEVELPIGCAAVHSPARLQLAVRLR
jgi:hypothetical protein